MTVMALPWAPAAAAAEVEVELELELEADPWAAAEALPPVPAITVTALPAALVVDAATDYTVYQ